MIKAQVWELVAKERSQVISDAAKNKHEVHFGDLFLIMGVKNAELSKDQQKVKARGVFRGSYIQNQDAQQTFFAEVQSTPATLGAVKVAMSWGAAVGGTVESVDCEAAYLQAPFKGVATWIRLPREWLSAAQSRMKDPGFQAQEMSVWTPGLRPMVARTSAESLEKSVLETAGWNPILLL